MDYLPSLLFIVLLVGTGLLLQMLSRQPRSLGSTNRPESMSRSSAPGEACLQVLAGPMAGRVFALPEGTIAIGRSPDNRIVLSELTVSRHHAQIVAHGQSCTLIDLDSHNGILLNGQRIPSQAVRTLASGDQVQVGGSLFLYRAPGSSNPVPRPVVAPGLPSLPMASPAAAIAHINGYTVTETIGQGGVATVYKGVSRTDGDTTVAIKVLKRDDPYLLRHFELEGRIQKALSHQHIAKVHETGHLEGLGYYLVMEYADAGNLRRQLVSGRPLPSDFAVQVIGQACEALDYAHQRQVIHRDIKPENILFSYRDGVKIVDFGIARLAGASTETTDGMVVGTPHYMSAEQCRGDPQDRRSDVYSTGVVLYEMMAGRVPFLGAPLEVIEQHISRSPMAPSKLNSAIPRRMDEAIMHALSKKPGERFQDARELAAALRYDATLPLVLPTAAQPSPTARPQPASHVRPAATALPSPLSARSSSTPVARRPATQSAVRPGLPHLVIETARHRELPLTAAAIVLGRQNIDPYDLQVSRRHACIRLSAGRYLIEDMRSRNGTYLNSQRVEGPTPIQHGDVVAIGTHRLRFHAS